MALDVLGPWREVVVEELEDTRALASAPLQRITLAPSTTARLVRIDLVEYWGEAGGLQYLHVPTPGHQGPSTIPTQPPTAFTDIQEKRFK